MMIPRHLVAYCLDQVESLQREFQKGLDGGVIAQRYLQEKLGALQQTIDIMAQYGAVETVERAKRK